MKHTALALFAGALAIAALAVFGQTGEGKKKGGGSPLGYSDTPVLPGQRWRVHDIDRPRPRSVTPADQLGQAPSDAIVLFDGKDLSQWMERGKRAEAGKIFEPRWKVQDGYFEVVPGTGDLYTKQKFGSCQLHVEWAAPAAPKGEGQARGNSGVLLMNRYEIQVLDSFGSPTYADGQAGSIYGQWPPFVNASRKPGAWQSYDIVFEAPVFQGGTLVTPAYFTVFHNGVLLHHRQPVIGAMVHRRVATYRPHEPEEPFGLQNHGTPVRYRNIWIRRLTGYDQP
jgi:hypothetical protein